MYPPISRAGAAYPRPALNAFSFLELLNANAKNQEWCGAFVDTGKHLTADPYAVNWQIKENTRSALDSPPIDLMKLIAIVRQSGYRGYLPIETLAMGRKDYDLHTEVVVLLTQLRRAIAKAMV